MKTIKIGRGKLNDVVIDDSSVSKEHALILIDDGGHIVIRDLKSSNGTFVNGIRIKEEMLSKGDEVKLGRYKYSWETDLEQSHSKDQINKDHSKSDINKKYTIGRSLSNDIVLPFDDVSSSHAELLQMLNGDIYIVDKQSSNGTTVNGIKIESTIINTGDQIFIAGHKLEWEKYLHTSANHEHKDKDSKISTDKNDRKKYLLPTLIGVIAIALTISVYIFNRYIHHSPIMKKYENSVVYLYCRYIYIVDLGKEEENSLKVVINDDDVIRYDPEKNNAMATAATGFFVSTDGKIITNQHVVTPWEYQEEEIKKIKIWVEEIISRKIIEEKSKYHQNIIGSANDIELEITKNIRYLTSTNIKVTGKLIYIGAAMNNTYIKNNQISDFMSCYAIPTTTTTNNEIDVAIIQLNNKRLPKEVVNIVNLDDAVIDNKKLFSGMKLFMIGYPLGTSLGETHYGTKSHYQEGILTREPDDLNFGHNLSATFGCSGSPKFNEKGQLVGIMNAGMRTTFNFAILAKHIVNTYKSTL